MWSSCCGCGCGSGLRPAPACGCSCGRLRTRWSSRLRLRQEDQGDGRGSTKSPLGSGRRAGPPAANGLRLMYLQAPRARTATRRAGSTPTSSGAQLPRCRAISIARSARRPRSCLDAALAWLPGSCQPRAIPAAALHHSSSPTSPNATTGRRRASRSRRYGDGPARGDPRQHPRAGAQAVHRLPDAQGAQVLPLGRAAPPRPQAVQPAAQRGVRAQGRRLWPRAHGKDAAKDPPRNTGAPTTSRRALTARPRSSSARRATRAPWTCGRSAASSRRCSSASRCLGLARRAAAPGSSTVAGRRRAPRGSPRAASQPRW